MRIGLGMEKCVQNQMDMIYHDKVFRCIFAKIMHIYQQIELIKFPACIQ